MWLRVCVCCLLLSICIVFDIVHVTNGTGPTAKPFRMYIYNSRIELIRLSSISKNATEHTFGKRLAHYGSSSFTRENSTALVWQSRESRAVSCALVKHCYRCVCRISTEQNRKNAAPSYSAVCSALWLYIEQCSLSVSVSVCVYCAHERWMRRVKPRAEKKSTTFALFFLHNFFVWWLCRLSNIRFVDVRVHTMCMYMRAGYKCLCCVVVANIGVTVSAYMLMFTYYSMYWPLLPL